MNVITTFNEKRREKQIKYERSVLKDLSINELKKRVQEHFGSLRMSQRLLQNPGIQEACYDVALEAYLLGAHFSKFGTNGEKVELTLERCEPEETHLIDTLFNFLLYWGGGDEGYYSESLYFNCEQYVRKWWLDGFEKGMRRQKLRLH
ncbi:YbaK family protein [Neobacillus sp. YIM B06451]|uniref:YbaK family protein n=1 Tax=Neobacillus sp. YIM B06451 TaxID=3070994 RepID=UPI0029311FEA|nr:YbaK family protein [Neobacillus sp. YIM B06451]